MCDNIWHPLVWEKRCKYASIIKESNGAVTGYISDAPDVIQHTEAVKLYRDKNLCRKYTVHSYNFGVYGNLTIEQKYNIGKSFCKCTCGLEIV